MSNSQRDPRICSPYSTKKDQKTPSASDYAAAPKDPSVQPNAPSSHPSVPPSAPAASAHDSVLVSSPKPLATRSDHRLFHDSCAGFSGSHFRTMKSSDEDSDLKRGSGSDFRRRSHSTSMYEKSSRLTRSDHPESQALFFADPDAHLEREVGWLSYCCN